MKKSDTGPEKNYTVSVRGDDGKWKLLDLDTIPKTEEEWQRHFEKKEVKTRATKEFLKYEFTHEEIHEKGSELARINAELSSIESEAKAVASNFKAQKDGKISEIEMLSNHINTGFEHRNIPCLIVFNSPNAGMKQTVRKDNGEIVRTEGMTPDELQYELNLKDEEDKPY